MNTSTGRFWTIFGLVCLCQAAAVAGNLVNVTVLYESLCGDSMRFIRSQLYPTYEDLKKHINVEFVPFGKASYARNPWWISCQHGPQECLGNAVQACALARYPDNEMQVKFVHCVMSDNYPPAMGAKCAKSLNYEYNGVEECARNEEGRQLLMYYGKRTHELMSRLSFVPTILFNGEYSEQTQSGALRDLKATVCKKLREPLPEKCR